MALNVDKTPNSLDLFRSTPAFIDSGTALKALRWLRGEGPCPSPVSIHLDLTLRCNSHCTLCSQWTWPKHTDMNLPQLAHLFSVFQEWGVRTITLGGGNPLLHPNAAEAIEMAHQAGLKVGLITEGAELSPDLALSIARCADWIRFSLDGPTPEIHDHIRNTPGLYQQALRNIAELRQLNPALNIGINTVIQKQNYRHVEGMLRLAEQCRVGAQLFKLPHGNDPHHKFLLSPDEYGSLISDVQRLASTGSCQVVTNLSQLLFILTHVVKQEDALLGRPVRGFYFHNRIRCFVPLLFLICDSEGNIYPCDYLQADTRPWDSYEQVRSEFCFGNIFNDIPQLLARREELTRKRIATLPQEGYDECGCCTRFFHLNNWLTRMDEAFDQAQSDQNAPTQAAPEAITYPFL